MQFNIKLKDEGSDLKVCRQLLEQPNITQYIRQLVLDDINRKNYAQTVITRIREEMLHTGEIEMQLEDLQRRYDTMTERLDALKEDLLNGKED